MTASAARSMSTVRAPIARRLHAGVLRRQHQLVDLALLRREPAAYGIRARDVTGLASVVGRRIHEQQIALFHAARRGRVVQHSRVGTAADDGRISGRHRAARQVDALDRGLDFALEALGPRRSHAGECASDEMSTLCDQHLLLVRRLDLTQRVDGRRQVHDASADKPLARAVGEGVLVAQRRGSCRRLFETQRQPAGALVQRAEEASWSSLSRASSTDRPYGRRLNIDRQERIELGGQRTRSRCRSAPAPLPSVRNWPT